MSLEQELKKALKPIQKTSGKIISNVVIMLLTTFIVFLLIQVILTDLIDDYIQAQLTTDEFNREFDNITLINLITQLNVIGLYTAISVSNLLVFRNLKASIVLLLSLIITVLIDLSVSLMVVSQIPGFVFDIQVIPIISALFMIYILRNPGAYIFLIGTYLIVTNTILNIIYKVDDNE